MREDDSEREDQQHEEAQPQKRSKKRRAAKKQVRRHRGEGTVVRRKDGRWQAGISLGKDETTGKRRRLTRYGRTKDEAYEKLHKALEEQRKGLLMRSDQQTVGYFLDDWLEHVHRPTLKIGSYVKYRQCLDTHIIPHLGHIKLQRLHQSQVQAFYTRKLDEGFAPSMIHLLHAILHKALDHAVKWEYVARNVCDFVNLPRLVKKREPQFLTEEQALHLLETLRGHRLEVMVALALSTGMRRGELLALRWNDINLEAGSIQLQRTAARYLKYGVYENEPKSDSSRRQILLPGRIMEMLEQHRASQLQIQQHAGSDWQNLGLVFTNRMGGFINPRVVNERFNAAVKAAGLPPMHFHDLRHSAATLLLAMGVHPKVVQELLGHSKISMTMDLYSHAIPSLQQGAMESMDTFLRKKAKKGKALGMMINVQVISVTCSCGSVCQNAHGNTMIERSDTTVRCPGCGAQYVIPKRAFGKQSL
jgi:integrase